MELMIVREWRKSDHADAQVSINFFLQRETRERNVCATKSRLQVIKPNPRASTSCAAGRFPSAPTPPHLSSNDKARARAAVHDHNRHACSTLLRKNGGSDLARSTAGARQKVAGFQRPPSTNFCGQDNESAPVLTTPGKSVTSVDGLW